MDELNLTPQYEYVPAKTKVVSTDPEFGLGQTIGGMQVDAQQLSQGKVFIQGVAQRILIGDATEPLVGTGIFIGSDNASVVGYDFRVGNPSGQYLHWDASTGILTVVGNITVSSIDIGGDDATSAHIDSSGNFWTGANIAGYASAPARISNAGAAVFTNVQIGGTTIQYQITNSGIFSFGDGSDGIATLDGAATPSGMTRSGNDYTMTRDVYFTNMTMSTGTTLNPAGFRIFGTGTMTLNGTAIIRRNGNAGGNGSNSATGVGGTAGAALADGYLKGSVAGQVGGSGPGAGTAGINTSNSIGTNGGAGGNTGGAGGTATPSNVKLIANWHLATMLDISSSGSTVKFDNSAGAGSGGSSILNGGVVGGGGGSASPGGIIAIYFRVIVIGASASIQANGGVGGNGGAGNAFGGGGGAGANGGQIILVYNTLTNSGSLTVTAGVGGVPGDSGGSPAAGATGTAGTIRQFSISL